MNVVLEVLVRRRYGLGSPLIQTTVVVFTISVLDVSMINSLFQFVSKEATYRLLLVPWVSPLLGADVATLRSRNLLFLRLSGVLCPLLGFVGTGHNRAA